MLFITNEQLYNKLINMILRQTFEPTIRKCIVRQLWAALFVLMAAPVFCTAQQTVIKKDSSVTVYIPVDLPDCMRQLDSILTPENKEWILSIDEKDFLARTHLALGIWIRNNWGLWAGSHLATYFDEQGIHHPDDMSGVILRCYYHYIRGDKVNYKRMLREECRIEKQWAKKNEKNRQKEKEKWEYEWRYTCSREEDTLSEEENEAFLHLPFIADSVTGVRVYLRNYGDSIAEDLRLMEQSLNREPRRKPMKDELVRSAVDIYYWRNPNGRVKSITIRYVDKEKVKINFNADSTISRFRHHRIRQDGQKVYIDEHYEYTQGHVSRKVVHSNDTLHSVTLYRFSDPCHCQELCFEAQVWNSLAAGCDTAGMATSSCLVVLSPEGERLATFRRGCALLQYDSLGREVLWIDSRDGYTVDHCRITVYDDMHNVYYEYQGVGFLYATVLNTHGDKLGRCCSKLLDTFDYQKTLFSYRYDRHGNWTRCYEKGKLYSRCKIRYY